MIYLPSAVVHGFRLLKHSATYLGSGVIKSTPAGGGGRSSRVSGIRSTFSASAARVVSSASAACSQASSVFSAVAGAILPSIGGVVVACYCCCCGAPLNREQACAQLCTVKSTCHLVHQTIPIKPRACPAPPRHFGANRLVPAAARRRIAHRRTPGQCPDFREHQVYLNPTELRRLPRVAWLCRRSEEDSAFLQPPAEETPLSEAFRSSADAPVSISSSLGCGRRTGEKRARRLAEKNNPPYSMVFFRHVSMSACANGRVKLWLPTDDSSQCSWGWLSAAWIWADCGCILSRQASVELIDVILLGAPLASICLPYCFFMCSLF